MGRIQKVTGETRETIEHTIEEYSEASRADFGQAKHLVPEQDPPAGSGVNGDPADVLACGSCGLVQRISERLRQDKVGCARCGTRLRRFIPDSRARTLALALAALALYAPANIYPVMVMDLMGRQQRKHGVVRRCELVPGRDGTFIGAIVFVASILIPVLKLLGLFFSCTWAAGVRIPGERLLSTK